MAEVDRALRSGEHDYAASRRNVSARPTELGTAHTDRLTASRLPIVLDHDARVLRCAPPPAVPYNEPKPWVLLGFNAGMDALNTRRERQSRTPRKGRERYSNGGHYRARRSKSREIAGPGHLPGQVRAKSPRWTGEAVQQ